VGFAPLPIGTTSLSPRSIGPGGWLTTTSPGIRRAVRPVPFIDILPGVRFPRCCHRFGTRLPPDSRSDLTVSHGLAGFLRRRTRGLVASRCRSWGSTRFHRAIGWLPAPSDSAIAGRFRCRSPRSGLPRIVFRTPRRTPPSRSRTVSPRPLPSRTSPFPPSPTVPTLPLPAAPFVPMPERTLSLRALLREKVRTGAHLVQVGDSLSSLGLVPLRGCLLPRERPSLSRYLTPDRAGRPCGRSAFRARLRRTGWVPCRRSG